LPFIVKITVGQPVNQPENVPSDLFNGRRRPESLFRNKDEVPQIMDKNANENPDPFISNDKNQIVNEFFEPNDIAIIYVDGARFLPENVSFTR